MTKQRQCEPYWSHQIQLPSSRRPQESSQVSNCTTGDKEILWYWMTKKGFCNIRLLRRTTFCRFVNERYSEFFFSKKWHHGVQVRHSHPKESGNRSKNGKYLKKQKGNHKIVNWKRLSNLSEMFWRHTLCHYGLLGGTSRPTVAERSIFVLLRCSVFWIYGLVILKIWLRCSECMDKIFWIWGSVWEGCFISKR